MTRCSPNLSPAGRRAAPPSRDMARALADTRVEGLATNLDFLSRLIAHPRFRAGAVSTDFIEASLAELV